MKKILFICIIVAFISCKEKKNIPQNIHYEQIDSLMQKCFERGLFNGAILVNHNNKVIYKKTFGYTNGQRTDKIQEQSIFNIGSISKEFSATAIMMLKEKNLLSLDDKLSKFDLNLPQCTNDITIEHLLKYNSGLPNYNWSNIETDADIYNELRSITTLESEPGTVYNYSNNNVFLRKCIIEKVTGSSYNNFIEKNILIPCGMTNTIINAKHSIPILVKGFNNDFVTDEQKNYEISGWIYTNPTDMLKWMECLYNGNLISMKSMKKLFERHNEEAESALGNGQVKKDSILNHSHHGSSFNFESYISYDGYQNLKAALMTNNKNFKLEEIENAIKLICRNQTFEIPKKSIYLSIRQRCYDNIDDGIAYYKSLKRDFPDEYDFENEEELLQVASKLLQKRKLNETIQLLTLIKNEFPSSQSIYANLLFAEAYYYLGKEKLALEYYENVLKVDPKYSHAKNMIDKIQNN